MGDFGTVLIWLVIIAAGTVAGIYTDSPWGGIIVAAIGVVISVLFIVRPQAR